MKAKLIILLASGLTSILIISSLATSMVFAEEFENEENIAEEASENSSEECPVLQQRQKHIHRQRW